MKGDDESYLVNQDYHKSQQFKLDYLKENNSKEFIDQLNQKARNAYLDWHRQKGLMLYSSEGDKLRVSSNTAVMNFLKTHPKLNKVDQRRLEAFRNNLKYYYVRMTLINLTLTTLLFFYLKIRSRSRSLLRPSLYSVFLFVFINTITKTYFIRRKLIDLIESSRDMKKRYFSDYLKDVNYV